MIGVERGEGLYQALRDTTHKNSDWLYIIMASAGRWGGVLGQDAIYRWDLGVEG